MRCAGARRWRASCSRRRPTWRPTRTPPPRKLLRLSDQVGAVFRQVGRGSDAIGRLGNTEFAVIAPATGADGAIRLVDRLGTAVEATRIPVRGGERSVRVKAGYCAVPDFAESSIDAVELLLRATTALRDLRRGGEEARVRAFEQVPLKYPS